MRRALVTGAASGIGRAIAARLEADGAAVLAVDLEPDPHGPGEPFEADLTTREGNRAAVDAALERLIAIASATGWWPRRTSRLTSRPSTACSAS